MTIYAQNEYFGRWRGKKRKLQMGEEVIFERERGFNPFERNFRFFRVVSDDMIALYEGKYKRGKISSDEEYNLMLDGESKHLLEMHDISRANFTRPTFTHEIFDFRKKITWEASFEERSSSMRRR